MNSWSCIHAHPFVYPCTYSALAFPASVSSHRSAGYSPVMYAAQLGDHQSVKLLLDNGACIKQQVKEDLHLFAFDHYPQKTFHSGLLIVALMRSRNYVPNNYTPNYVIIILLTM